MPVIGPIATVISSLYIDRKSSKDKSMVRQLIKERQQLVEEEGRFPPLVIYPEGATSNGTQILRFKTGAFEAMKSVKPMLAEYKSEYMNIENSNINLMAQSILTGCLPPSELVIHELPVFKPNDFFLSNHVQEGEQPY